MKINLKIQIEIIVKIIIQKGGIHLKILKITEKKMSKIFKLIIIIIHKFLKTPKIYNNNNIKIIIFNNNNNIKIIINKYNNNNIKIQIQFQMLSKQNWK